MNPNVETLSLRSTFLQRKTSLLLAIKSLPSGEATLLALHRGEEDVALEGDGAKGSVHLLCLPQVSGERREPSRRQHHLIHINDVHVLEPVVIPSQNKGHSGELVGMCQ